MHLKKGRHIQSNQGKESRPPHKVSYYSQTVLHFPHLQGMSRAAKKLPSPERERERKSPNFGQVRERSRSNMHYDERKSESDRATSRVLGCCSHVGMYRTRILRGPLPPTSTLSLLTIVYILERGGEPPSSINVRSDDDDDASGGASAPFFVSPSPCTVYGSLNGASRSSFVSATIQLWLLLRKSCFHILLVDLVWKGLSYP